jgi:hypothetical protein
MTTASKNDLERAEKLLGNPVWRINNLYQIIDKEGRQRPFKLNWAQEKLHNDMWYCNVILKARQLGISTMIGLLFLDRCLFNSNLSAGIICHTREDSEAFFRRIKFAYDQLPNEIKASRSANSDTKNELTFSNGSSIRVGMMMRGSTLQYLHVSEFGKISAKYPEKAREIITGSLNTIQAGQYVFIESTAEGRDNVFYDMCKKSQALKDSRRSLTKLDFRFHFYSWHRHSEYTLDPQHAVIPAELTAYFEQIEAKLRCKLSPEQRAWYVKKLEQQKEDMKREFPSTPEECWETSLDGNYYSSYLTKARQEGRITSLFHDPTKPVYSAWDLGYSDSTSIWLFQIDGQRINILEYYENSGEALPYYIEWIKAKRYTYEAHFTPHDASQHEYGSGLTRTEIAKGLGVCFTQVPSLSVVEGIDAARNILNRCYFDEKGCYQGIKFLDAYRKQWNDKHGCWSTKPLHNFASHCADAFRMLAIGVNDLKNSNSVEDTYKAVDRYLGGSYNQNPIYQAFFPRF